VANADDIVQHDAAVAVHGVDHFLGRGAQRVMKIGTLCSTQTFVL
jgi:hypothetical protein